MITTMTEPLKPTDEQKAIIEAFGAGDDIAIQALAGTGKSTTLKMLGRSAPDRRGVYIAFNRAVAEEARASFLSSTYCATGHSLAFQAVGYHFASRLNERVTAKAVAEKLGLRRWVSTPPGRKNVSPWKVASLAVQTVQRYCQSAAEEISRKHVPIPPGLEDRRIRDDLCYQVLPAAQRIWEGILAGDPGFPCSHDVYFKIWALSNPQIACDYLMVDECQDTNGALAGIIENQRDTQVIVVGDSQQALFGWRGSVDIMADFVGTHLTLQQSFRFGDEVAEEANKWLGYLESGMELRGTSSIDSRLCRIDKPNVILCRTNAAVIENAMREQENGLKVAVVGGTRQIEDLAQASIDLDEKGKTSHHDLSTFASWDAVLEWVNEERPGGKLEVFVKLIEEIGAERIISAARRCCSEADADINMATTHAVKGLEWDRVKVDSGMCGSGTAGAKELSREDMMVAYVAVTRAKLELDAGGLRPVHERMTRLRRPAKVETASKP